MRDNLESIVSRGISVISKFALVVWLAKIMSVEDFGSFQLISYFVLISTSFIGLEYYNYSNRKIGKNPNNYQVFKNHINFVYTLAPIIFTLLIGLYFLLFPSDLTTSFYIFLVILISICDYLSQEVYRYLIMSKEFRKGNLQLIYKSTLFLSFILIYNLFQEKLQFFELIIIMAISYCTLLIIAYRTFIKTIFSFENFNLVLLSKRQLRKTLGQLFPFIILAIFLKGIEFADKFLIGNILGLKEAGIYSFLYSLGTVVNVFMVSGIYLISLPNLIKNFGSNNELFKSEFKKYTLLNISGSILIIGCVYFFSDLLFIYLDKSYFNDYSNVLTIILIGFFLNNLSLIPHMYLYVSHKEKIISFITMVTFFVGVILTVVLLKKYGIIGAAYSFVISYFCMFIFKLVYMLRFWKMNDVLKKYNHTDGTSK